MPRPPKTEMIKDFIEEVKSYIPSLIDGLASLKERPDGGEVLEEIHRLVHTIKGASSMVGLTGLSHIAFQMEEYLEDTIAGKQAPTDESFQAMHQTIELFQEYCLKYPDGGVNSRVMLADTIAAFRHTRGLSEDENDQTFRDLFELVPEHEGLDAKERDHSETCPQTGPNSGDPIPRISEDSVGLNFPPGFIPGENQRSAAVEEEIGPICPGEKNRPEINTELLESFYEEAEEHLDDLGRSLNALESQVKETISISPSLREETRRIRRSVHTLKGAAAVIGFQDFSTYAHSFEDLLDWLYEEAPDISPGVVSVLAESSDLLERLVSDPREAHSAKAQSLKSRYKKIMGVDPESGRPVTASDVPDADAQPLINLEEILQADGSATNNSEPISSEEAVQGGNTKSLDARFTKTLRVDMARVDELVNLSGELIIALSAFDQKMEIFMDSVNDLEISRERLKKIARDLEVSYEVKALEQLRTLPDYSSTGGVKATQPGGFDDFDTLELDRYSELNMIIRTLNESSVDVGALHTQLANLYSDFDGHITRQQVVLSELQDKIMRIRMTPMSFITNKMRRTVREVAGNLDKKVNLVVTGEDIELDRLIWEKITDPLMHLLRNAVDHGVEPQSVRQSSGKPSVATVKLDASREGNQVVIRIADDGAGLNYSAIRETARKMQLMDNADELSEDELCRFIFYPGFSTRSDISEISGRGVGMDVVKENIQSLKGVIRVASEERQGTQFTIRIPLTLAAVQALLFTVGGQTYAVALNEISEIIRLNPENVLGPHQDALKLNDEVLPLFRMEELLSAKKRDTDSAPTSEYPITLVVETGGKRGTLVIDSLVGQREIVIKSLGSHLRYVKGISGVTIMGDGSVVPILNIEEFLWSETSGIKTTGVDKELMEKPLEIMVVDDSVSIRQVVSRLMEDQGWKVHTAKDGIDALEKLMESRPDLIVLDIEMPRMNGYEFLGAIKTQPGNENIPVVMLTSRTAEKHRDKAMALGARGFVIKPYNDDEFIGLIRQLTG
jgi:chemosensory pili system protein ChpA (sensor histidine kinase/response regulator)